MGFMGRKNVADCVLRHPNSDKPKEILRKSAKVTIWLFENPLRNTQLWAKRVCGSLSSPYLAAGRQVSAEAN
jgi:hypothetical protein